MLRTSFKPVRIVCRVNSFVKSIAIKFANQIDIRNRKVKPVTREREVPYNVSHLHFILTGFLQHPLVLSLLLDKLSFSEKAIM